MKQTRFPTMRHLKPPRPTIRTQAVARRIAQRIVSEVNLDEFYWERHEIEDRVDDVTREIMRVGRPRTVFHRLYLQQPLFDGQRGGDPYGWEGIEEHCESIADEIADEELRKAVEEYERRYLE